MDVADRHPLDPSIGDDYSKCRRGSTGSLLCGHNPVEHCHCDYHDGRHGCTWGNAEFVRRLTEGWRENRKQLRAREVAHTLAGSQENIMNMTVAELRALPVRKLSKGSASSPKFDRTPFRSFVVLPKDELHETGYRAFDIVIVSPAAPMFRLGCASDNISLDGIGGHHGIGDTRNWQIDCLPKSGLLHVFNRIGMVAEQPMSTFEPVTAPKEPA